MHAVSRPSTRRRSRSSTRKRTYVAQAASRVCRPSRITYPSALYTTPLNWSVQYDSRGRVKAFERPGNSSTFQYDSNTNRLSALQKTIADSDLDGDYEAGAGTADVRTESQSAQLIAADSNRLLSLSTFTTRVRGTRTLSNITKTDEQQLDAAGNLLRDGSKTYSYDAAGRISKVSIVGSTVVSTQTTSLQSGSSTVTVITATQTASVVYKHNSLGQRVFKSEPQGDSAGPDPAILGADFAAWLKKNFGWLYAAGQSDASVGTAYAYPDESSGIPSWALMGEYDNGSASGKGRTEYIWLPVQSEAAPLSTGPQSQQLAGAIPIGFIRNNRIYAIHSDHLGTPRLVTDDNGAPIWQWPYSAFGDNAATGVLRVTTNAAGAITNQPQQLRATTPQEFNLRFPGQYFDAETKLAYNYFRNYQANTGRYTQSDPIGLDGGWNRFGYAEANTFFFMDPEGLATGAGGNNFGITDAGFWKWWEVEKYKWGPFDNCKPGKEFDLPDQRTAKQMKEEYDRVKTRDSGRGGKIRGGGRGGSGRGGRE